MRSSVILTAQNIITMMKSRTRAGLEEHMGEDEKGV
jgi:hypothetical protein